MKVYELIELLQPYGDLNVEVGSTDSSIETGMIVGGYSVFLAEEVLLILGDPTAEYEDADERIGG